MIWKTEPKTHRGVDRRWLEDPGSATIVVLTQLVMEIWPILEKSAQIT